jgi:aryl carrier-like protein
MDPARPLSAYGMDSLAALELRNWLRGTVAVEFTTLEVMNAPSLVAICEKMIRKMGVLGNEK